MVNNGMGTARIIKEFVSGNLKTAQVKVAGFHLEADLLFGMRFFLGRGIDTLGSLVIVALLETCPSRIDGNETFQNTILNHTDLG